ncbi:cell wall-binding protein [Lysinibacillus sp. NPDC096418]|uniref:cell wall-binding protein n=1 Tax=Lysinibacillus sp. NPDC096418 TaxID=3364138 RepID=UPI00381B1F35
MKNKLKAGVLTSLLLAPATIANAQEVEAPSQIKPSTEQTSSIDIVAATDIKERIIAQFGKLSVNSTPDEMGVAEGDVAILGQAGFNPDEITFITAKYDYIVAQRRLLADLKKIGGSINTLNYSSKTFLKDVDTINISYTNFLGKETALDASYLAIQEIYKKAVSVALTNGASTIAQTVRGTSLQYSYNEADRNNYFKTNGADIAKLFKMVDDANATETAIKELDSLVALLDDSTAVSATIKVAVDNVTKAYDALTSDQKKIVVAYNPKNDAVTPYKKYTNTLTNLTAAEKVSASISQFEKKNPADFSSATNFISAVKTIETTYNKLDEESKKLVGNYNLFEPFKEAAEVSKQIADLRISSDAAYREAVNGLMIKYTALAKKEYVKNVVDLTAAEANIQAAVAIETQINAIKDAPLADKVTKINAAREAYNSPSTTANVKKIINNLTELTDWEKKYSVSLSVDKLIAALNPTSSTFENQTILAKAAFDRLGDTEKSLVKDEEKLKLYFSYADLSRKVNAFKSTQADYKAQITALQLEVGKLNSSTAGENATALDAIKTKLSEKLTNLLKLETDLETVIKKINDLPSTQNLVEDMLEARNIYEALDSVTKKRVTNIKVLTDFEKSQKSMLNVIALIEKLDHSNKDYIKKAKSANSAYLKLDEGKRTFVKSYKGLSDKVEAIGVIAQIDALKITKKTYKDDVLAAENAYAALKDQVLVTNYSALQAARGYITEAKAFDDRIDALANEPVETFVAKVAALTAEYKAMNKNSKKLVEKAKILSTYEKSNKDVVKVINLIAALNPNSKDYTKKVLAARKAYNALDEISQKRVTNYASLTAVEDVASLIGLIASLKPTSKTFLKDLETARANYDALPENKKAAIINYELLVKAETELTSAHTVIALIDVALPGEDDYLTKLMNARIAYDNLSSGQKKLVSNIKDLTNREREVKPILNVMVQIENLDPEQKNFVSKVNSARNAYDKLTKDQKKYVNNIAILQNYEPVSSVIELIGKLKSSSKTFHEDTIRARALYDALSEDSKQYVSNYYLLQAAETSILGASNVSRMINDLPSVDPKQYIKRIEEIRAAYNALPSDQKKAVENYHILQEQEKLLKPVISIVADIDKLMTSKDIESQYQKILKAYDKLSAMQRRYVYNEQIVLSLDSVINVVKSIAELKPSDKMYFSMIESARRDYNSLSSTDKQKVVNYSILLDAEENMSNVKKVVSIIAGLSTSSSTYVQDVANATAAYKALDSKLRGQVLNEDVLKKAEKDVAAVLKVVDAIAVIDPEDRSFEKKVSAAQKLYSGLTIEQQGLVYNYRVLQEYLDMQY